MPADNDLAHALRLKFGLAPGEPNAHQLASIKARITGVRQSGRTPTTDDWRAAVASTCPTFGTFGYKGLDNSDLNTLLALALQAAQGRPS